MIIIFLSSLFSYFIGMFVMRFIMQNRLAEMRELVMQACAAVKEVEKLSTQTHASAVKCFKDAYDMIKKEGRF